MQRQSRRPHRQMSPGYFSVHLYHNLGKKDNVITFWIIVPLPLPIHGCSALLTELSISAPCEP